MKVVSVGCYWLLVTGYTRSCSPNCILCKCRRYFKMFPILKPSLLFCSQVQQAVLAVLPLLKPANDYLSPLWLTFIYQVLSYLPDGNHSKAMLTQAEHLKIEDSNRSLFKFLTSKANGRSSMLSNAIDLATAKEGYRNGSSTSLLASAAPERPSQTLSVAFSEKLIKVVLELHEACPPTAAATCIPDIVAAFGRYVKTLECLSHAFEMENMVRVCYRSYFCC